MNTDTTIQMTEEMEKLIRMMSKSVCELAKCMDALAQHCAQSSDVCVEKKGQNGEQTKNNIT